MAVVKLTQTSGGACLNTNWNELKTDQEKVKYAPKGMECKDLEGGSSP